MKKLKMVIPKGRLSKQIIAVLNETGLGIDANGRRYIPVVGDPEIVVKIMKPQNIPQLLELGSHDIGFTGFDWVKETGADVLELMDLGLDPVKIVSAVPAGKTREQLMNKRITVVSEYRNIALSYLEQHGLYYNFIRSYGATEVFPPDDAELIVDNTSTGQTLAEHNLAVLDTILLSTTRLIANKQVMSDPFKREKINEIKMLLQAVLDARDQVMLEMNVPKNKLDKIVKQLPCMRAPTVAPLYQGQGFAVKIVIKRAQSLELIPRLKSMGATDILESDFQKVVV